MEYPVVAITPSSILTRCVRNTFMGQTDAFNVGQKYVKPYKRENYLF